MTKSRLTRRQLLAGAAAAGGRGAARPPRAARDRGAETAAEDGGHEGHEVAYGHAAMIGDAVPAPGGPTELDALLYPPPALPAQEPDACASTSSSPPTARSRSRRE